MAYACLHLATSTSLTDALGISAYKAAGRAQTVFHAPRSLMYQ